MVTDGKGDHILSGNVFEPRALNELLPDWQDKEVRSHIHINSGTRGVKKGAWFVV